MKKFGLVILMIVLTMTSVFAGGKALELVSSSIEDGAKDVTLEPVFELEFSNNVINMKVQEGNKALISLVDADNHPVAITVEMADDQVSPDLKRMVTVKADNALEANQSYKLIIGAGFSAKNGSALSEDVTIAFETEGGNAFSTTNMLMIAAVVLILVVAGFSMKKKNAKA